MLTLDAEQTAARTWFESLRTRICAAFEAIAVRHSDRRGPPADGIELCNDYRCFWSLNFAIRRATFQAVGGFDPSYFMYCEDMDLCRRLAEAGARIHVAPGPAPDRDG